MENQWQPIQTAPKDGSNFLMFITGIEYRKNNDDKKYKAKTIKRNIIANSSYEIYDIIDIKTSA
jgi:hypothetical protein